MRNNKLRIKPMKSNKLSNSKVIMNYKLMSKYKLKIRYYNDIYYSICNICNYLYCLQKRVLKVYDLKLKISVSNIFKTLKHKISLLSSDIQLKLFNHY